MTTQTKVLWMLAIVLAILYIAIIATNAQPGGWQVFPSPAPYVLSEPYGPYGPPQRPSHYGPPIRDFRYSWQQYAAPQYRNYRYRYTEHPEYRGRMFVPYSSGPYPPYRRY